MIWFEVAGYLLVGAYLGYRFRLRQGDSNLDHGERAFLTVLTMLHLILWPIVFPVAWLLGYDLEGNEILIPLTPKWFAVRKIKKRNMLEKGRQVLAGEVDPFEKEEEEEEKANIGSWGSYPYNILTFPQQTSTTPYTYYTWGQTNNTKTNP